MKVYFIASKISNKFVTFPKNTSKSTGQEVKNATRPLGFVEYTEKI
jgi:hypothetical protein